MAPFGDVGLPVIDPDDIAEVAAVSDIVTDKAADAAAVADLERAGVTVHLV